MAKRSKLAAELARARMQRMQGGGPGAWQATTVGLTMAGCSVAGFLIGAWLDGRLGTGYWTPVIGLLGVGAGFREVIVTVGRLNRQQQREREQLRNAQAENLKKSQSASSHRASSPHTSQTDENGSVQTTTVATPASTAPTDWPQRARTRIFEVPPPPQPTFGRDAHKGMGHGSAAQANAQANQSASVRPGRDPEPAAPEQAAPNATDEDAADTLELLKLLSQTPDDFDADTKDLNQKDNTGDSVALH